MPDETIKVTFQIRPTAKRRLSMLKQKLLDEGFQESESSLVERLLAPAFLDELEINVKTVPRAILGGSKQDRLKVADARETDALVERDRAFVEVVDVER